MCWIINFDLDILTVPVRIDAVLDILPYGVYNKTYNLNNLGL